MQHREIRAVDTDEVASEKVWLVCGWTPNEEELGEHAKPVMMILLLMMSIVER